MARPGKRRRRKPRAASAPRPEAAGVGDLTRYTRGYVLVHGIGPTEPGSTLEQFARPAFDTLVDVYGPSKVQWVDLPDIGGQRAAELHLHLDGAPTRTLFIESRWTPLTEGRRRFTPQALWWLLSSALILLPYAIGPNAVEGRRLEASLPEDGRITARAVGTLTGMLARVMWRVSTLATWATAAIAVAALLGGVRSVATWIVAGVLGAALVVLGSLSRTDLAGQVRLVATDPAVSEAVVRSVTGTIDEAARRCRSVTVLGHSQGGYIGYRALRREGGHPSAAVDTFMGVASGLKPISVLAAMQDRKAATATLASVVGSLLVIGGVWSLADPGMPLDPAVIPMDTLAMLVALPLAVVVLPLEDLLVDPMGAFLGSFESAFPPILCTVLGATLLLLGRRARHRIEQTIGRIDDLPGIRSWEEWATPHDIVGRMYAPEVPERVLLNIVPGSHPLGDHGLRAYTRRGSPFRLDLTAHLVADGRPHGREGRLWNRVTSEENAISVVKAARWQALRGNVQVTALLVAVVFPMLVLQRGLGLVFGAVWWVALAVSLATWVIAAVATRSRATAANQAALARLSDGADRGPGPRATPAGWKHRRLIQVTLAVLALSAHTVGYGSLLWAARDAHVAAFAASGAALLLYSVVSAVLLCVSLAGFRLPPLVVLATVLLAIVVSGRLIDGGTESGLPVFLWPGSAIVALILVGSVGMWITAVVSSSDVPGRPGGRRRNEETPTM